MNKHKLLSFFQFWNVADTTLQKLSEKYIYKTPAGK